MTTNVYIMTSNNPTEISPDILTPDRTKYVVSIDPPDFENALAVVKFYFSGLNQQGLDYDRIGRAITNCSNGKFSNSGIEELYKQCCTSKICTTDGIINLINKMSPNITRSELDSYENDKKVFLGR